MTDTMDRISTVRKLVDNLAAAHVAGLDKVAAEAATALTEACIQLELEIRRAQG